MADYINDNEIPVFLINGFLESGKTAFINYTISEEYFHIEGNTLLVITEQGEVEYDEKLLKREHTYPEIIEDQEEMTAEQLQSLLKKHGAERVIIEFNGMWDPARLELPKDWVVYQQLTIMSGLTMDMYLNNMRSLMGPMLKNSELCIVNRCDGVEKEKLYSWKKQLRPMLLKGSDIVMENRFGEIPLDTTAEDLPYDVTQDPILIEPEDYGTWFLDIRDYPERYQGKNVQFTACIMKHPMFPKGWFVPGRMAMTCCEADMSFLGYMAYYKDIDRFADDSWVKLTAKIDFREMEAYEGKGPVLEVTRMIHTGEIREPAGF